MSEIRIKKISVSERHIWYESEIKRLGELLKKTEELTERIQMLEMQNTEKDEKIAMLEKQVHEFNTLESMYQNKISEIHDKILVCIVSKLGTVNVDDSFTRPSLSKPIGATRLRGTEGPDKACDCEDDHETDLNATE